MSGNKTGRDLQSLLLGLAMLVGGLFLLFTNIRVGTNYYSLGRTGFFGMISRVPSGMMIIPFIIGIVLIVIYPNKLIPKIVTGLGLLIIVLGIIASVKIEYIPSSFFDFLLMIVLIFVGAALCLRILLSDKYGKKDDKK